MKYRKDGHSKKMHLELSGAGTLSFPQHLCDKAKMKSYNKNTKYDEST
jgi:hypothetical protein